MIKVKAEVEAERVCGRVCVCGAVAREGFVRVTSTVQVERVKTEESSTAADQTSRNARERRWSQRNECDQKESAVEKKQNGMEDRGGRVKQSKAEQAGSAAAAAAEEKQKAHFRFWHDGELPDSDGTGEKERGVACGSG
ncbi:hypothetical protein FGG08_005532 [Glutinoglossum americanum]|uniref:Uncharacterized protein n=1 Tax=Glutinoglossum americanum TaxID=1670608 RepID=A0A9P8HUD2_9PEZI|nr:hypothetical protein FGG08_005532 [Glutinoglossum americanum]